MHNPTSRHDIGVVRQLSLASVEQADEANGEFPDVDVVQHSSDYAFAMIDSTSPASIAPATIVDCACTRSPKSIRAMPSRGDPLYEKISAVLLAHMRQTLNHAKITARTAYEFGMNALIAKTTTKAKLVACT
jgi:hypothetical protein